MTRQSHLVIVMEQRFLRLPHGPVMTESMYPRQFWDRYLRVYERVTIAARTRTVANLHTDCRQVEGGPVSVWPFPHFVGPMQFLRTGLRLEAEIARLLQAHPDASYLLRVPGTLGTLMARRLRREQVCFGVEVVGDPWDVFSPIASSHPLRPLWRALGTSRLKAVCRNAGAAIYVTDAALQGRYPSSGVCFAASDVELPDSALVGAARTVQDCAARSRMVVTVGSLDQPYKGTKTLLEALALLSDRGLPVRATIVGQGRLAGGFVAMARAMGIDHLVVFTGGVPAGEAVRRILDQGALFVLPSLVEGLPRALVEAMARALPAIASRVGGIPELLPSECLVEAGDANGLAIKMKEVLSSPELAARLSHHNLVRAQDFREARLQVVRDRFLRTLSEIGPRGRAGFQT